jgi:D-xylose transport system substrate-binding protein
MKLFTNSVWVIVTVLLTLNLSVAEAVTTNSATIEACALLPDTTSSSRYELFDQPLLAKAFMAAGIPAEIYNAQGVPQTQLAQARECLDNGAKVILLDALDQDSGIEIATFIVNNGAKVIAYDRLIDYLEVSYYVSFDSRNVGVQLGMGLVKALKESGMYWKRPVIAVLNGAITDNNAILFKEGYDAILGPLFKDGTFKKAIDGDQWTGWDPQAALKIFKKILRRNHNHIDGVLAANDNLAVSVVSAIKNNELRRVALTGQDATVQGVQFMLSGRLSGTVYKSIQSEAVAAVKVVSDMINYHNVVTNGMVSGIPAVLLDSTWITKKNYTMLFSDGFLNKVDVCTDKYAKYCKKKNNSN